MNRFDRVTAILIHLQSRKIVKAQDLADRFRVSLRTVYRDIKTLERAGIPILSEPGVGYSIMEGYRLPPVLFTASEAVSLLTAEKLVENITDTGTSRDFKSAMYKIRSVLRRTDKELIEKIEGFIGVPTSKQEAEKQRRLHSLQDILSAISEKKRLFIHYFTHSKQEKTERFVEPVGIFYSGGNWHLIAYCCLRNDYRDFRVDRIRHLSASSEKCTGKHPTLKEYLERVSHEHGLEKAVIRVKKNIIHFLEDAKYWHGFVSEIEKDEWLEMTFLTSSPEAFIRWYLMFADHAEIVGPDTIKKQVKSLVKKIASGI